MLGTPRAGRSPTVKQGVPQGSDEHGASSPEATGPERTGYSSRIFSSEARRPSTRRKRRGRGRNPFGSRGGRRAPKRTPAPGFASRPCDRFALSRMCGGLRLKALPASPRRRINSARRTNGRKGRIIQGESPSSAAMPTGDAIPCGLAPQLKSRSNFATDNSRFEFSAHTCASPLDRHSRSSPTSF